MSETGQGSGSGVRVRGRLASTGRVSPDLLAALCVAALAFLLYAPSLHYDFTNWDDPTLVIGNPRVQGLSWQNFKLWWTEVYSGNYMPLTLASFALDHAVWKLDPFGYHLQSVLLHASSSALFVLVLLRLGAPAPAAALGAAIFALHPAQVESIAWVAERSAVLSMFFLLASFLAYAHATRGSPPSGTGLLLSFGLFLAALLSKVIVVTFPAVLFLYDLGHRREPKLRMLIEKTPFLLAAAVIAAIGYRGQVSLGVTTGQWLGGTPGLHVATMAELLARYARILLFPTRLSTLYDLPDARFLLEPLALVGYALFLAGAAGLLWAWRRERRALAWMGFFWVGFLPVAQIVTYTVHMADRYLYMPSLGAAAGAGFGAVALAKRLRGPLARACLVSATGIVLACFAGLTLARERIWRDPASLWADTVERQPVHWGAYYNYAETLTRQGNVRAAIPYYERAIEKKPDFVIGLINLAAAYAQEGQLDRASALLRQGVSLEQAPAELRAISATNLGLALASRGRHEEARRVFQEAISLSPRWAAPRVHLARTLRALGRVKQARTRLEQALELDPRNPEAELGLAALEIDTGAAAQARQRLDALIARGMLLPEALLERARVHAKEGNAAAARTDLDRALDLVPPGEIRKQILEARDKLGGRERDVPGR